MPAKFRIEGQDATDAAFRSVLGHAKETSDGITRIFQGAFAGLSIAAVAATARGAIEMGDQLEKARVKAGLTAKSISELAYAAKQSDVDLGSLSTSLRFMQKTLSEAASGGKEQQQTLEALGLTFADLKRLKPDQQFEVLAQKISELKDPADRARAATELFGRAGAELLPMFENGAKGIRTAREEAERMNAVFTDEQLKKLSAADDAIKRMDQSWKALWVTLTSKIAPALTSTFDLISGKTAADFNDPDMLSRRLIAFSKRVLSTKGLSDETRKRHEDRIKFLQLGIDTRAATAAGAEGGNVGTTPPGFADVGGSSEDLTFRPGQHAHLLPQLLAQWNQDTQTATEREIAEFRDKEAKIHALRQQGLIDQQEEQKRLTELIDDALPEINVTAQHISDSLKAITPYAEEAMRGIQDSFYRFIRDPFQEGIKGLGISILSTFRDVLAQMAAVKLSNGLIGQVDRNGNLTGGLFSTFLSSMFGGFMAEGGPLQSGKWYIAGEHGPEPVWGGGRGAFATGYGSGGQTVQVIQNVNAQGATVDAIKLLPSAMKQASDDAVQRVFQRLQTGRRRG